MAECHMYNIASRSSKLISATLINLLDGKKYILFAFVW